MQPREPAAAPAAASQHIDRAALGFFRRSTIRARLTIGFLFPAFALGALGVLGAWELQQLSDFAATRPTPQALQEATRSAQAVMLGIAATVVVALFCFCYPLVVAIVKPIRSFPGGRRFHFTDPSGNELAVWEASE